MIIIECCVLRGSINYCRPTRVVRHVWVSKWKRVLQRVIIQSEDHSTQALSNIIGKAVCSARSSIRASRLESLVSRLWLALTDRLLRPRSISIHTCVVIKNRKKFIFVEWLLDGVYKISRKVATAHHVTIFFLPRFLRHVPVFKEK